MTRKLVPVLAVAVLLSSGWLAWNLTLPTYSPSRTRALNSAGGGGPAPAGADESESPPTAPTPAMATGGGPARTGVNALPAGPSRRRDAGVLNRGWFESGRARPGAAQGGASRIPPPVSMSELEDDGAMTAGTAPRPAPHSPRPAAAAARRSVPEILAQVDLTIGAERARVVAEMTEAEDVRYQAVLARAHELGLPIRREGPGHRVAILHDMRGHDPLYKVTWNANAAISSAANLAYASPYSLSGSGVKVGIWDAGSVRATHRELSGRVTLKNSSTALDDHATHVAGTIGASGVSASARGMAPASTVHSYDWNNDYAEMTAAGAATAGDSARIPISNHSYGYEAYTEDMGRYENEARAVDALAAALPYYLPFWAAGNEQDVLTAKNGYQSITFTGLAKNVLTVGAVDDAVAGGARSLAGASMSYFSSWGPCDDGRIKPDVVANGVSLYSSIDTSDSAYASYSGTSMATPSAAGSAALLAELYAREFSGQMMRASTLKALLIHTADDLGAAGPDYQFGWGLIHTRAAADVILAHKASLASPKMIEGALTAAVPQQTHVFTWDGVHPIRATLCWTDPPGAAQTAADSRTPNLVHNLDLRIIAPDGTTVYQPFVMPFVGTWSQASMSGAAVTGDNNVDPVEQVQIAAPTQPGVYTARITLDGSLTTSGQAYSLILTGGTDVEANPPPTVSLTAPDSGSTVLTGESVTLQATAADLAIGGEPGAVSAVEFLVNGASLGVDVSAPYEAEWTPTVSGIYRLTAVATDTEAASASSADVTVSALTGDGSPVISSFTPSSGKTGTVVTLTGENFAQVTSVRFNGVESTSFTAAHLTTLVATVPSTATTGPIRVGTARGAAVSANDFTVLQSPVLISQVYGGGGQSGATLKNDYVELYNRSATEVSLDGWTIQYASSAGTSWLVTPLSGTLPPETYYLVALAGGSTGAALPTADATGATNMSATKGKVALRDLLESFTGSSPLGQAGLQDFVGYGSANAYEGAGPAPAPSTTAAIFRAGAGAADTGDNAADFTTGAPNPRNSSGVPSFAPVITSPSLAGGTVGAAFAYQITASNGPFSYGATGLPTPLSADPSTGWITGTPQQAGTFQVVLSATNGVGTGTAPLTLTITGGGGGGGGNTVLFSENMGTPSGTTAIADHAFQNAHLTFSGTADVRSTNPSSGYEGASGAGNVFVTNTAGRYMDISGINTLGYSNLALTLGHYKSTTAGNNELVIEVSPDGVTYSPLSYTRATGSGTATWMRISPSGEIPSTDNLHIRFRQTSSSTQFRVDDVMLTGTRMSNTPVITALGELTPVPATYGAPSTDPASFRVSGAYMTEGILIAPPPGFEVSQTIGGADGYADTQTVGGAGTIAETTVYVRLKAGMAAGSYSGDLTCTSAGAIPVTLATAPSTIRPAVLVITATDREKPFGTEMTLGPGQTAFTRDGLALGETIGSVTLTAGGGLGVFDAPGDYELSASNATGGSFTPSNYDISYSPGVLTVVAESYDDFVGRHPALGGAIAPEDDPEDDHIPNLLEYFLGLNPTEPDTVELTPDAKDGVYSVRYRRSKNIRGVTGGVVWKSGLLDADAWSDTGVTDVPVEDRGDHEIRKASISREPGPPLRFMRLRVIRD